MSKPSRRPARQAARPVRLARRQVQEQLREHNKAQGLTPPPSASLPNHMCPQRSVEEERTAREDAAVQQARILHELLPILMKRFSKIKDVRDPKKCKHKLSVLLLYGLLMFVYQQASRREANRTMTRPVFMANLKLLFPELESVPHHDTLYRLLERIDVTQIEAAHRDVVRRLLANRKFRGYLIQNCYPIAIDGSQKMVRDGQWCDETLQREVKTVDGPRLQHYVYVLEANLAFHNGMTVPLMSEFLSYADGDVATAKQDCEQKAFERLARRLKREFSHLPLMVLLDGLYPNGPMFALCRKLNWDFMIVLQDGSLPSVWREARALKTLLPENEHDEVWRGRQQHFWWVNDIRYSYGPNDKCHQQIHVVVCEETWQEVAVDSSDVIQKTSRHAWISGRPLSKGNLHQRCNLGARHRWSGIETSFLVEKHQGYSYEHCFAYQWNAMKGYHFLMRLAHMLNVIAQHARALLEIVKEYGVRGFIQYLLQTLAGPWLDPDTVRARLAAPFQLRLC